MDDVIENDTIFYLCPFYTSRIYAADWSWEPVPAGVEETVSFAILDERTFREGSPEPGMSARNDTCHWVDKPCRDS